MRIPAGLAIAVCVALLAGCAPAPAADPMSDELRAGIAQERAGRLWRPIAEEYPEALQPSVSVDQIGPDFDRIALLADCYRQHGFDVKNASGGITYGPTAGMSQIDFEVRQYECAVKVVLLRDIASSLDEYQLGALYDYYVSKLRPCLQFAGQPTTDPPDRADFLLEVYSTMWSPYDAVTQTNPDAAALAELERRCPALPGWLHL